MLRVHLLEFLILKKVVKLGKYLENPTDLAVEIAEVFETKPTRKQVADYMSDKFGTDKNKPSSIDFIDTLDSVMGALDFCYDEELASALVKPADLKVSEVLKKYGLTKVNELSDLILNRESTEKIVDKIQEQKPDWDDDKCVKVLREVRKLNSARILKSSEHTQEEIDFVVDQEMEDWLNKNPDSTDEEYSEARKRAEEYVLRMLNSSKAINSEFIPVTSVNLIKDAANELNDTTIVDVFSFGPEVIVVDLDTDDYDEASQIADSLFELLKEKGIDISYDVVDQGEIMVDVDDDMQDMKMIKITEVNS